MTLRWLLLLFASLLAVCHGGAVAAQEADDLPESAPTTQAAGGQPATRPDFADPYAASLTYQFLQRRIIAREANVAEDLPGFHFIVQDLVDYENIKLALQAATKEPTRKRYERSEEHTSELQSQSNLVCRLLLEKKK